MIAGLADALIALVRLQGLEACLQEIEGFCRDVQTAVCMPVSLRHASARLNVRAFYAIENCFSPTTLHDRAGVIPLRPGPETVVENDIEPEAKTPHPNRFQQIKDGLRFLSKYPRRRILAEEARHPLIRRKSDRSMPPFEHHR